MIPFPEYFKFYDSLVEGLKVLSTIENLVLVILGVGLVAFAGVPFLFPSTKERRVVAIMGAGALVLIPIVSAFGLYINLTLTMTALLGTLLCLGRGILFLIRGK